MDTFLLKRLLISIPTMIGISIIVFGVISLAPGDPFAELALNPNVPAEIRESLRRQLGIDDPGHIRYVKWAGALVRGDWGFSFTSRVNTLDLIGQRLPTTLFIMGTAYLVAMLVAVPVGTLSAIRQYSWTDAIATTFAFLGYSLPTFFTGLLLILVFSINLRWFPMIYSAHLTASGLHWVFEQFRQSIMPITVVALFEGALLTRYVRAAMLDVISQDYVRTARAKGLVERRVIVRHALRNALIPVVTILALQLPNIFTGAIITEQIFRVPGIGSLLIGAIQQSDTPVVMAIVVVYALVVVVFSLIADVLYGTLDPRVKYQ
jgi:peptide/nickel transport system permease protein